MANCPTPHNSALPGDFARTVLMPGDPLRAKFIAENYLTGAGQVNNVRGIHGYTGFYKGTPVSVMASGMGMPSIGIYSYELYNFYGVENIMRVGSAGAIQEHVKVRDVVFGLSAGTFAPAASFELLEAAVAEARRMGVTYHVGNIFSSDTFYNDTPTTLDWQKMGTLAVEMEAAALYMNAARAGKRALAICTVSDHIVTGEATTAAERQNSFTEMMEIALETALRMEEI